MTDHTTFAHTFDKTVFLKHLFKRFPFGRVERAGFVRFILIAVPQAIQAVIGILNVRHPPPRSVWPGGSFRHWHLRWVSLKRVDSIVTIVTPGRISQQLRKNLFGDVRNLT